MGGGAEEIRSRSGSVELERRLDELKEAAALAPWRATAAQTPVATKQRNDNTARRRKLLLLLLQERKRGQGGRERFSEGEKKGQGGEDGLLVRARNGATPAEIGRHDGLQRLGGAAGRGRGRWGAAGGARAEVLGMEGIERGW